MRLFNQCILCVSHLLNMSKTVDVSVHFLSILMFLGELLRVKCKIVSNHIIRLLDIFYLDFNY